MLTFQAIDHESHLYEFGPEDAYVQYRYASAMPWQYLATLCSVLCRRVRGTQVVFFSETTTFADHALQQENSAWALPASVKDPSNDLVIPSSNGALLYPATRDGVQNAATLLWYHPKGWCRLVRDRNFRERLLSDTLTAQAMLDECDREWVAELRPHYDTFEIVEGPRYLQMAELLPACIDEANDDYS